MWGENPGMHDSICIIQRATFAAFSVCVAKWDDYFSEKPQAKVCVYVVQLYFSALSGFAQRLMTPTAFVPTKNFHLWLRHVVAWPTLYPCPLSGDWLWVNSCSVVAVNKSLPHCNLWEEETWNHWDNPMGCGSKTELTDNTKDRLTAQHSVKEVKRALTHRSL